MADSFKRFEHCILCGHNQLEPMIGYEACYLAKCRSCKFVFVQRIPSEPELIEHYSRYPRSFDVSDLTIKRYNQLLDTFESSRKHNRILDVGAGNCLFLIEATKRGWQAYGTDFGQSAVDIGTQHGINMKQGKLSADWYPSNFFDVVTTFETIEHVNSPNTEIENIQKILRPGGLVYLTTPNFNSIERRTMKINYNAIEYPEHLSYYTPHSMNYLLRKHGFEKVSLQTTGVSLTRLKTSLQVKNHQAMTELFVSKESTDERLRLNIESNKFKLVLKNMANALLTFFGIGNSLKALYRKK